MMGGDALEMFLARIPNRASMARNDLARYFVYFLTSSSASTFATPAQVAACFRQAELNPFDDIRFYLNRASQKNGSRRPLLVRDDKGYRLERSEKERIAASLSGDTHTRAADSALRGLVGRLALSGEQEFLDEAVKCYEVGAFRAVVVLTWLLTLDHLYEYILQHQLASFNSELAKVKDKRVRATAITSKDDFSDIPEGKFIEIARAANILSNDVRKILDQKLGIRNTYAHPSNVTLPAVKASDFVQDLVNNVVLKYSL